MNGKSHWAAILAATLVVCALGILPARAGLVHQWWMEAGSGTTAFDNVGGMDAAFQSNAGQQPAWVTTGLAAVPSGTTAALYYDSGDRLFAQGYKGITGTNPRSISAWVDIDTAYTNRPVFTWGKNNSGEKWTVRSDNSSGALRVEVNGGYQIGEVPIDDGAWHHVAVTWADDGSPNVTDARLWVDGELQGVSKKQGQSMAVGTGGADPSTGTDVRLGRDYGNRSFRGTMDEARIYDTAIDRSEVRALAGLAPDEYFETVKAAGPVGYWRLGEGVGTKAFNEGSLGSSADGTYKGSPVLGQPSGAPNTTNASVEFDSNSDYVEINGYTGITGTDPRSISAWIKTTEIDNEPIISWGANNDEKKWTFRVQDENGQNGAIRIENNSGYQVGTTNVADGQWHHVAVTWEDDGVSANINDARLWVDGVLQGVSASQGNPVNTASSANVRIGRGFVNSARMSGSLDEVQVYDRALSRNELRALAGVAADEYFAAAQSTGPVGYWRLGEPSGGKAFNEGTLGSAADGSYKNDPTRSLPALAPNTSDTAIQLNGSNEHVQISGYKGVTGTDPRTVSAWIQTDNGGNHSIISWGKNSGGQKWNFRVQDSNGTDGAIRIEVNGGYIVGNFNVADGLPHHVAATWADDGSPNVNDVILYVDGVRQLASAVKGKAINTASDRDVYIGRDHSNRYFDGALDEVMVHDRALDAREIRLLATGSTLPLPTLNYDASLDTNGNAVWEDEVGRYAKTAGDLDYNLSGVTRSANVASLYPGIKAAYVFDGSGTAKSVGDIQNDFTGDPTNDLASFEVWFKPAALSGQKILWDLGGATDGSSLTLDGSTLQAIAKDNGNNGGVTKDLTGLIGQFVQAVMTVDRDADLLTLFVNGELVGTAGLGNFGDWAGTNGEGLGSRGGSQTGGSGGVFGGLNGYGNFVGEIAAARMYSDLLTAQDVADLYNDARNPVPEPATVTLTLLGLSGLGLRLRKRRRHA